MSFTWGIVGYGWVARDHMAPAIQAAGHRLLGIADPCPDAQAKARSAGAETYAETPLLLDRRPDAIYVATPNHLHLPPVRLAADYGIAVLCEKPMAASLADAEEIAAAARLVTYGTAFDQRHHPAHRAMREALAVGAIGRVTAIRIVYACWVDPSWRPPGCNTSSDNWRANPEAAGGGAVMDLALHGLDLAEMLLGEPLTRLHIALQRRVHDYPVDDGGMLTGRFESGALLAAHVAYNCPEGLPRRRLEVVGETGAIVATDTMGQSAGGTVVRTCGRTGATEPLPFDAALCPFTAQARAFAAAVEGKAHDFSAARDIRLMRLFAEAHAEASACL
jgi:predicted dehydrogenase